MIDEIQKAKQGMADAGLKETDYGALFFPMPSNSMKFQYSFLDSVIERAESVEVWYDEAYNQTTPIEGMGDVYEQKMDNLREFLREEGRADWIAKRAWYAKYHKAFYFSAEISAISFVLLFFVLGGRLLRFWVSWTK